jgi:hypothetical protein
MKKWAFTVGMLAATSCFAGELQYKPPEYGAKSYEFETHIRVARACMRGLAMSYLNAGTRDMEAIVDSATAGCGKEMKVMLASESSVPPASIDPFIRAMAYDELGKIPGVVLPMQGK